MGFGLLIFFENIGVWAWGLGNGDWCEWLWTFILSKNNELTNHRRMVKIIWVHFFFFWKSYGSIRCGPSFTFITPIGFKIIFMCQYFVAANNKNNCIWATHKFFTYHISYYPFLGGFLFHAMLARSFLYITTNTYTLPTLHIFIYQSQIWNIKLSIQRIIYAFQLFCI